MTIMRRQLLDMKKASADALQHPLLSGAYPVAVITAESPMFPAKTEGGMPAMAQELQNQGLEFEPTEGRFGQPENSYIVHGLTRQQAFDLGNRYGQEAVVYAEGGKHELMYTNGANIGRSHPGVGIEHFDQEPSDYFLKVPSTDSAVRLKFDADKVQDTPMRPLVAAMPAYSPPMQPVAKREELLGYLQALRKCYDGAHSHPHAYDWHDSHSDHHFFTKGHGVLVRVGLAKSTADADVESVTAKHPSLEDHEPTVEAGSQYAAHALPFGTLDRKTPSDLRHYPLHGRLADVQDLVREFGHQVFHYGGYLGRPNFVLRNYDNAQLGVAPLTGDVSDRQYADSWRQTHELAHALTHADVNNIYGEGRRLGKLGVHLTQNEAMRAVHWEWLAAHKQRELLSHLGIEVPDDVFNRELNTVMHDAVHRATTGETVDAAAEGFHPHSHQVPLEVSLKLVRDAAHNLGLRGSHDLLKSERSADVSQKTFTIPEVRTVLAKTMKERIASFEAEMLQLRKTELLKSDHTCVVCHKDPQHCECMAKLQKNAVMGYEQGGGSPPAASVGGMGGGTALNQAEKLDKGLVADREEGRWPVGQPRTTPAGGPVPQSPPKQLKIGVKVDPAAKQRATQAVQGIASAMGKTAMDPAKKVGKLPGDKKPVVQNDGKDEGSGGDVEKGKKLTSLDKAAMEMSKQYKKSDVPMAKPPGVKAPTAAAPMSSPKPPKVAGAPTAPKTPMGKTEKSQSPILAKALPRIGGKDSASQMMTQHAASAGAAQAAAPAPTAAPVPKLSQEQQAVRAQQFTDFMPKGAFTPAGQGLPAAGAMKPAPTPPAGVGHLKPPTVGKPMGTSATPGGGHLARFTAALMGKKTQSAPAPAMKGEMGVAEKGGSKTAYATHEESPGEHHRPEESSPSEHGEAVPEAMQKKAPPGFSEETMHKLKAKHGTESAFKIAWAAYEKQNHKKSEFKKSLGNCALCGRDEHSGPCSK